MNELSLFTGAGGGIYGSLLLGWRTIGYVEYDNYCQRVIAQRIKDGIFHEAPIFGDIRAFLSEGYADAYRGLVDVLSGGFPCQPFSVAGKRAGADDERNMWPATIATIRAVQPRFAFLENVPGLLTSGYFGTILGDLAESGYDARWRILSAAEVGAPHRRERLWIVAHAQSERQPQQPPGHHGLQEQRHAQEQPIAGTGDRSSGGHSAAGTELDRRTAAEVPADVAHADKERRNGRAGEQRARWGAELANGCEDVPHAPHNGHERGNGRIRANGKAVGGRAHHADRSREYAVGQWWESESGICRVVDELAHWCNQFIPAVEGGIR